VEKIGGDWRNGLHMLENGEEDPHLMWVLEFGGGKIGVLVTRTGTLGGREDSSQAEVITSLQDWKFCHTRTE